MLSGIYKITNTKTGKFYIGSSINCYNRFREHKHKLKTNKHNNRYLQQSFNKNGADYFEFEVIYYCSREYLIKSEQYFIDELKPQYNIRKIAESNAGLKHSEETKRKKREIGKIICSDPIYRNNMKVSILNSKDHTKYRKSLKEKFKKGFYKPYKRISDHLKPVLQYDKKGKLIKEWERAGDFEKQNTVKSKGNVSSCCKGKLHTAYGYIWKYKNN